MPHHTRPMAALLIFTGLNAVLLSTITPVYDYVCFHPYWERRSGSVLRIRSIMQTRRSMVLLVILVMMQSTKHGEESQILKLQKKHLKQTPEKTEEEFCFYAFCLHGWVSSCRLGMKCKICCKIIIVGKPNSMIC
ncbi:hypothetical protein M9H77_23060 [Catharanthus roseus]|uniref:Uncharacterized protein n=1 Tax=Catharanthus roseus TaxID=4058 RepID=A0ACC0AUS5_CATRO|nr:hypothetical protein M9H77_23060 [Catharanthus roseus]